MSYWAQKISERIQKNIDRINYLEKQTKVYSMIVKLEKLKEAFYQLGSRHISNPSLSLEVFEKTYANLENLLNDFEVQIKRQNFLSRGTS